MPNKRTMIKPIMNAIKASAPATVANVSCGFDIFGFAVASPCDEVTLMVRDTPGVVITGITGDEGRLPMESDRNTAGVAVREYLRAIGSDQGIGIELTTKRPLGSAMAWHAGRPAAAPGSSR